MSAASRPVRVVVCLLVAVSLVVPLSNYQDRKSVV